MNDTSQGMIILIFLSVLVVISLIYGLGEAIRNAKEHTSDGFLKVMFMDALIYLIMPYRYLVTSVGKWLAGLFGVKTKSDVEDVTEEEIISMVNEGHEQGVLQASEAEMITNIFELGDKEAKDIMTHRKNILAVDGEETLENAVRFMLEEKNSRYPVYEENIDNIIGILHIKDALRRYEDDAQRQIPIKDFQDMLMEARFIPETRNIDTLFKTMQSEKIHMVIVVDEYGQTEGLIAMEDILEEIVGNIMDEYDEEEVHIKENADNTYVMEGMTTLEEVEDLLGIQFEEEEDFDTLNGFLIEKLGRIPEEDEQFETDYGGYHFKILEVENKMITSVLVTESVPDEQGTEDDLQTDDQPIEQPLERSFGGKEVETEDK